MFRHQRRTRCLMTQMFIDWHHYTVWAHVERTAHKTRTVNRRVHHTELTEVHVVPITSITLRRVVHIPLLRVWSISTRLRNLMREIGPCVEEVDYKMAILDLLTSQRRDKLTLTVIQILLRDHVLERMRPHYSVCLLYTSPSPRDKRQSRMPSSA